MQTSGLNRVREITTRLGLPDRYLSLVSTDKLKSLVDVHPPVATVSNKLSPLIRMARTASKFGVFVGMACGDTVGGKKRIDRLLKNIQAAQRSLVCNLFIDLSGQGLPWRSGRLLTHLQG